MKLATKTLLTAAFTVLIPVLTFAQYTRTDLVTNTGAGGTVEDGHLVNAWGLVSGMFTPFWVNDNATGLSTLYSISTKNGVVEAQVVSRLVVAVPTATGGSPGTPTGIVAPLGSDFVIPPDAGNATPSGPAFFIFATQDGTIRGWNPTVDGFSPNSVATIAADRSDVGAM